MAQQFPFSLMFRVCPPVVALIAGVSLAQGATTTLVSTPAELNSAIAAAQPGDTILMANGAWMDLSIDFDTDGLPGQPITLRAEVDGQVTLEGTSTLDIAGDHLVVQGLHFTNGAISSGHIVEFRGSSSDLANNSRLTECAITGYNPPDPATNYKWVSVYGLSNRVDHCSFTGMNHIGVTLTIWLGTGAPANHTRIDNNYFADRAPGTGNGFETIRIGTSTRSMQDSEAVVESNYFYRCDGEIEIISSKSGGNIYRYNTFEDCEGQLTLRHGNDNVVEGNFFLGNNNTASSGVRVIGEDHTVINNYFENLRGTGTRAALAMMNGVPNSPLNRYFQVQRALVAFNTFVGCRENLVIGTESSDGDTTLPPLDCMIANNIVKGSDAPLIDYETTPINMQYEGNIFHGASLGINQPPGITIIDPLLALAADGLMRPATNSPAIDAATTNYPVMDDMDGHARVLGTQDVGADEFSLAPPVRGPLTATEVGPRWMQPHPPGIVVTNCIVDDSWASGTRTSPPNDASYWSSTSSSGNSIEVYPNELGLISGTSGRGNHAIFASQPLSIGDTLVATLTFTTPATVGAIKSGALRFGLFDTTAHLPGLEADLTATSSSPNTNFNNLNGYMMDLDVATGTEDITIRERDNPTSGRLLATTGDYSSLGSGGASYSLVANTAYTVKMSATRQGTGDVLLEGSVYQGTNLLSINTEWDTSATATEFGMLGMHVNSSTFGSTTTAGQGVDNGLTFSNIKIELITTAPAPPPTLDIMLSGGNVILSWPTNGNTGFDLESTLTLTPPSWSAAGSATVVGDEYQVTVAASGSSAYYRLRKP